MGNSYGDKYDPYPKIPINQIEEYNLFAVELYKPTTEDEELVRKLEESDRYDFEEPSEITTAANLVSSKRLTSLKKIWFDECDLSEVEPFKLAQLVSITEELVGFDSVKLSFNQMKYLVQFSNETEMWRVKKMRFWYIQKDCIDSNQLGLLARNIPEVVMINVSLNWYDFERGFFKNSSKFNGRCRMLEFG